MIHLLHSVIIRAFAIFQIKCLLTVFEGNLFLCQVVAQTETRSQFPPMVEVYYLRKVPKEIEYFIGKRKKIFSDRHK